MKKPSEAYYTPSEVRQLLGNLSWPDLYALVKQGYLKAYSPPGKRHTVYLKSEVDAFKLELDDFKAGNVQDVKKKAGSSAAA